MRGRCTKVGAQTWGVNWLDDNLKCYRDYVEFENNELPLGWKWKSFEHLPLPREDLLQLKDILNSRFLTFINIQDTLLWVGAKSEKYTWNEGYNIIIKTTFQ